MANTTNTLKHSQLITVSVYSAVRNHLRERLVADFAPGDKLPSERQLARDLNVSSVTVSRALQDLSRDGVLYRVPGSGTFLAEPSASSEPDIADEIRHLPYSNSGSEIAPLCVGIITQIGDHYNPQHGGPQHDLISSVERCIAAKDGRTILVRAGRSGCQSAVETIANMLNAGVNSIVMINPKAMTTEWRSEILRIANRKSNPIPVVDVRNDSGDYTPFDSVAVDAYRGVFEATECLIRLGHRNITYVCPHLDEQAWVDSRLAAFHDAKVLYGLPITEDVLFTPRVPAGVDDQWNWRGRQVGHLVANLTSTGVICANDHIALGVISEVRNVGRKIPETLAVIGYDDVSETSFNDVSTVHPPYDTLGPIAVDIITHRLRGDWEDRCVHIAVKPVVIHRASTGSALRGD